MEAPPAYNQQPPPAQAWQQPPPGAPPVAQPASTTVVVQQQPPVQQQTVVTATLLPMKMSQFPMNIQCPNCQNIVTTCTIKETGGMVWLAAGLLLLFGLWLGCCLIPFCIDSLKDTVHICPVCKFTIGKHSQL